MLAEYVKEKIRFRAKFRIAYRQIDFLKQKIDEKENFLGFIELHKYSQEELLNSKYHHKIHSCVEKISDDIRLWEAAGNLSIESGRAYEEERNLLEYKLNEVNETISKRNPTFWEKVASIFEHFVNKIIDLLPVLLNLNKYLPKKLSEKLLSYFCNIKLLN